MIEPIFKDYVLIINIGNYLRDPGGTNKVVLEHCKLFHTNGISTICIYPYKQRFNMGDLWGIIVDQKDNGIISSNEVKVYLSSLFSNKHNLKETYIHHLRNLHIEALKNILSIIESPSTLYVHDFYTVCPGNYLMLDNNGCQCNISKYAEDKCLECKYYLAGKQIKECIEKFIYDKRYIYQVIAPSELALQIWKKYYSEFEGKEHVVEHLKIKVRKSEKRIINTDVIRVAFLGVPKNEKGWLYWANAIEKVHSENPSLELHYFGRSGNSPKYITEHDISFQSKNKNVVDQMRENEIDIIVLWSIVNETYSYTFFEAFSAGCYILTNSKSGNIAEMVRKYKNGHVYERPEMLTDALLDIDKLKLELLDYYNNYSKCIIENNDELLEMLNDSGISVNMSGSKYDSIETIKVFRANCTYRVEKSWSSAKKLIKKLMRLI